MLNNFRSRILSSIILILILITLIFGVYTRKNLIETYETNRLSVLDRNRELINQLTLAYRASLLKTKKISLLTLEMIYTNDNPKNEHVIIDKLIRYLVEEIEENYGKAGIILLDEDFNVIKKVMNFGDFTSDSSFIESFLERKNYNNYYKENLYCNDTCGYFVFEEIELPNGKSKFLIIGSKINHLADNFNLLTNSEVIILKNDNLLTKKNHLTIMNGSLEYATNYFKIINEIKKLPKNLDESRFDIEYKNLSWEVSKVPTAFPKLSFIILDNVTDVKNKLDSSKYNSLLILSLSFLMLTTILFFLLRKPLKNLRLLGSSITLLGESKFEELREVLVEKIPGESVDEIELIHNTAFDVSFRLEKLEKELRDNAETLYDTLETKTEQYLFLKSLLDYSQIIIISHDENHIITMTNNFFFKYFPVMPENILGMKVSDIFRPDNSAIMASIKLSKINNPTTNEVNLKNSLGEYWINWMHCRVPSRSNTSRYSYLSIGVDITERKHSEQKLKHIAEIDALTGLYNRRIFYDFLDSWILKSKSKGLDINISLFFIDLDKFKQINDTLGHDKGDDFLKRVAGILKSFKNRNIISGRLGGDEFAVILYDISHEDALSLARSIVLSITSVQQRCFNIGLQAGASVGVANFPEHGKTPSELISSADFAMYRAKHSPNEQVFLYTSDIDDVPLTKLDKRKFINRVIQDDLIDLYLQPINHLHSKEVYCYECLSRLRIDSVNNDTTANMFKYGEESGLSSDLDAYILDKIFSSYKKLSLIIEGDKSMPMFSINISAKSITQGRFIEKIIEFCEKYNVNYRKIIIEITETGEILDIDKANEFINKLKALGVMVALDDFGDGFATLRYLRNMPFDLVKIDGQFVINIDKNKKDQIIVESLVSSAKRFGLKVVVECVETLSVYNFFKTMDVDYVQGYFIEKPAPFESIINQYKYEKDFSIKSSE